MAEEPRMVQVRVTHVIDPHNFHAQIGSDEFFESLGDQDAQLNAWGEKKGAEPANLGVTKEKGPGDWVVAYSTTWGKWVRAQINLVDTENGEVDINCVDYGTTEMLNVENIISEVDETFTQWAPNAYPCTLAGVTPIAKNWITRASRFFEQLVLHETLTGQVLGYDDQNLVMLDLLVEDENEIISASDLLFKEGLGKLVSVRPESEVGKVPDFDVNQLWAKLPPPVPHVQREPTPPAEDIEKDIFRTLMGADKQPTKWIPSDQMIGENYQANVDDSTILTLQEELRQMSVSTDALASLLARAAFMHHAEPTGVYQPRRVSMMHECSPDVYLGKRSGIQRNSRKAPVSVLKDSWSRKREKSKDRQWSARSRGGGRGRGLHQCPTDKESGFRQDSHGKSPSKLEVASKPIQNGSADDQEPRSKRELEFTFKTPAPVRENWQHSIDNKQDVNKPQQKQSTSIREQECARTQKQQADTSRFGNGQSDNSDRLHASRSDDKQWRGHSQGNREHTESRFDKKSDCWNIPVRGRGDGDQSNDGLSDGSQSGSNSKSVTDSPPRGKQTDARRRYGPAAVKKTGYMQNEYDWQSSKVQRKGKAILKSLTADSLGEVIGEFSQLVYPAEESKLANLPGPKELHICIQLLFSFVADHPQHSNLIIALLEHFKGDKGFVAALNDSLQESLKEYIVVTTNVVLKRQRTTFLQFLGHLYITCQPWTSPAGEPIVHCVTTSFDTWCEFNMLKQHASPAYIHEVYIQSLRTLLQVVGPTLEQHWPAKVQEGFDRLKLKAIDVDLEQSLRLQILDVLVQQVAGWPTTDGTSCNTRDRSTGPRPPQPEKSTQLYTWELTGCADCGTMTDSPDRSPGCSVSTQTSVLPSGGQDPYRQVTHMLEQLNMTSLLEIFKDNAIRDSLLDMQFPDLRELLREVGVKVGYIWQIKAYLETQRHNIPQLPVYVSSPSPQSSSCGDLTDPEVAHFTDDSCPVYLPPPPCSGNSATAALGPVFIPPHRFQLLTPSNFTSGNFSTPADFDPGAAEVSPPEASGNSMMSEERGFQAAFNTNNSEYQNGVNSQGLTQRQTTSRADDDTNWRTRHFP